MDPRTAAARVPDPDAVEFVRFCYRRRRVGWPELYDEMCAVAARGLFRGLGADDLAGLGIGFSLFDMPALAAMAAGIVAEEQALRRPVAVVIAAEPVPVDRARRPRHDRAALDPMTSSQLDQREPNIPPTRDERTVRRPASALDSVHRRRPDPASSGPVMSGRRPLARSAGRSAGSQARMRRLAISPSIWRSAST